MVLRKGTRVHILVRWLTTLHIVDPGDLSYAGSPFPSNGSLKSITTSRSGSNTVYDCQTMFEGRKIGEMIRQSGSAWRGSAQKKATEWATFRRCRPSHSTVRGLAMKSESIVTILHGPLLILSSPPTTCCLPIFGRSFTYDGFAAENAHLRSEGRCLTAARIKICRQPGVLPSIPRYIDSYLLTQEAEGGVETTFLDLILSIFPCVFV